jgi:hypothetical protein
MKVIEEEVVHTTKVEKYVAEDGTVFKDKEECKRYEESALFVIESTLKKINKKSLDEAQIFGCGSGDTHLEIFNIKNKTDLVHLKVYCNLKNRSIYKSNSIDKITSGHEVVIFWDYDYEYCWTFGDGSIDSILNGIRMKFESTMKE